MGRLVSRLIGESPDFDVVASLSSASPLGEMEAADLVVDFTHPAVSPKVVEHAVGAGLNVLVGTSGWSGERITALSRMLEKSPETGVVIVPNFSIGSALVTAFSAMAASFYESIEIIEAHHGGKVDSPSGTAVRTAELIGTARELLGPVAAPHTDQRARGQQVSSVPIHSVRMQGVIARQEVMFGGPGELVTLRHDTTSPQSYEAGILLGLAAARDARGVVVGLESLINLFGSGPR
jgi:4-hydroxy-tetrahydrodipicolinate reductase